MLLNFKNMSDEDLRAFWGKYSRAGWHTAEKLLGCRNVSAMHSLAAYAINLAAMRSCERSGKVRGVEAYKGALLAHATGAVDAGLDAGRIGWAH